MKAFGTLETGTFKSVLKDERGHEVMCDLTEDQGGEDSAPSALELSVLSMAGCITTIWAIVAKNSNIEYSDFRVEVDAHKDNPAGTIGKGQIKAWVTSGEDQSKLDRCFEKTLKVCPVGQLWERAGVDIEEELIINS